MLQVEVAGKTAHRYRAYGDAKLLRSPTSADHYARAAAGKPPYAKNTKIEYTALEPVIEDEVEGTRVKIRAKAGQTIRSIVFYADTPAEETEDGDDTTERVVGSIEVDGNGPWEIEFVEPADPATPTIIKEGEL